MKYWLLTTEYPPMHGGGISTYCYFTAQMLSEAGNFVTIFTPDHSLKADSIKMESEKIVVVTFNSNRDNLHKFMGYTARLSYAFATVVKKMIAQEGKPDFIEVQDYLGIGYYLTQFKHIGYSFLQNIPILLTLHSPAFIYLEYNRVPTYRFPDFWTGEMEKQTIAAADGLISPTNFLAEEIGKYMSTHQKNITIIENPYSISEETSINIDGDFIRNKIVYYGKLSPQKGSFALIEYFKQLWDNGFKHPLHIIGGTDIVYHPDMKMMGQMITNKYAAYVSSGLLQLHGKINPAHIKKFIGDAHVIIVPSIVDNLPYVVMEAMSLGKVVLASVQGGQKEMLEEGVSGFLFDHNKPDSFSKQLKKILLLNNQEIINIGHNALERVKSTYSFASILAKKMEFLHNLEELKSNSFPFLYQQKIVALPEIAIKEGLLSVIIPFFNMGNYIEECIESVLRSSFKNIEIIIINDGSTDNKSLAKLNEITKIVNVVIINSVNKGVAETRNFGAAQANGEFLAFLDADDKVAPTYYQLAIDTLNKNDNVFFVGCWVKYFENSHNTWPAFTPQPPYILIHNSVNSSALVYKRKAFLMGGLHDKKVDYGLEDYESVIQMLSNGFNGVVLPEVLFFYRIRTGSMIRNITPEKLLYSNKYIIEKHKHFYTNFTTQVINLLNANGPAHLYDNPTFETNVSLKIRKDNILFFKLKNLIRKNGILKKIALTLKKTKFNLC